MQKTSLKGKMPIDSAKRAKVSSDCHERLLHIEDESTATKAVFNGMFIYIVPTGMGKGRLNLFKDRIIKNGGQALNDWNDDRLTHIVADNGLTGNQLLKLLDSSADKVNMRTNLPTPQRVQHVVKIAWLTDCLKMKTCLNVKDYLFDFNASTTMKDTSNVYSHDPSHIIVDEDIGAPGTLNNDRQERDKQAPEKKLENDAEQVQSSGSSKKSMNSAPRRTVNKSKFICALPSSECPINHNQHITEKLEALAAAFKSTQDHWRALGYERAISVLKKHNKEVTTWEEARSLPGIGERLADKIWEIIESGRLRKMEEVCSGEKIEALNIFMNIWGVGATTAQSLVQQGFRTLEDIWDKADLNRQQKIGLKYYQEFLERMPREEAAEIEAVVKNAALSLQSGLEVVACGSYRRGKTTCGDVDVLLTHSDGKSHQGLLSRLLSALHHSGFLTDDLVAHEVNGNHHKYLGVCKLPGETTKHRRLDIIVVPYSEFACSLLYFTGSAHFNRSMRLLARKMNMGLSEHSLNAGVVRKGQEKICNGHPLPTPTEESVFQHLGIPYRPPEERDH